MRRFNFDWKSLLVIISGVILSFLWIEFLGFFSYRCPDGRGIVVPSGKQDVAKVCKQLEKEAEIEAEREQVNAGR